MSEHVSSVNITLSILKIATVALGFVIVRQGWLAWRATGRRSFFWLTAGIGTMTIGAIAEGVAYQGLQILGLDASLSLDRAHIIEGVFTLGAFGILVYSLYMRERASHVESSAPIATSADPEADAPHDEGVRP